jgi:hypothetical protein
MQNRYHPLFGISARRKFLFLIPFLVAFLLTSSVSASSIHRLPAVPQDDLPDLVITDVWTNLQGQVCFQIHNIGTAETKSLGVSGLRIDGQLVSSLDLSNEALPIDGRLNRCIAYSYACTGAEDLVVVGADITQLVAEAKEDNNTHTETWRCDTEPPEIVQGPYVYPITATSATVGWVTQEDSDSIVVYDTVVGRLGMVAMETPLVSQHDVELAGLQPDTTYQYQAISTDVYGNQARSEPGYFRTLPVFDGSKPSIGELTTERLPGDFVGYRFTVPVSDDQGIERLEFSLDGALFGMAFPPAGVVTGTIPLSMDLFQGFLHLPDETFFDDHIIGMRAFDRFGNEFYQEFDFRPPADPFDGELEILEPDPGDIYYSPSSPVPSGTELALSAYASVYEEDCRFAHVPGPEGEFMGCVEYEDSVDRVEFYIDADLICTTTPDYSGDLYHDCDWPIGGLYPDTYQLLVQAYAGDTTAHRWRDIEIRAGATALSIERSVTASGPAFTNRLTIRNTGTLAVNLTGLTDNLHRLQPVHKTATNYTVASEYDYANQKNLVQVSFNQLGHAYYALAPGASLNVEYQFVPVLYPDLNMGLYSLGDEPVRLDYTTGATNSHIERSLPANVTDAGTSLRTTARTIRENADYLIVTNPHNLFTFDPSTANVNALFSGMAELAVIKEGILAYLVNIPGPDTVDDTLEAWGDGMLGSDGVADHWLSNGYLLLVGELPIIPAHSRYFDPPWYIEAFVDPETINPTDVYYADTSSNTIDPELNVGRIVGNNAAELLVPIRTITNVYRHTTGYSFNWTNALILSGFNTSRGGGSADINFAAERNLVQDKLDDHGVVVDEMHTPDYATTALAVARFFELAPGSDFIHLVGHGFSDCMDDLCAWDLWPFADPFGSANPLVYASSCLTGDYTSLTGLAENFLAKGAGLYLGSTEVSYCCVNKSVAGTIYNRFDPGDAFGPVVKSVKRDIGGFDYGNWATGFYEDIWTTEYHIFGDPEYGGDLGLGPAAALDTVQQPSAISAADTFTQSITVPAFTISEGEFGEDLVTIPDGGSPPGHGFYVLMPGHPLVPTYQVDLPLEPGVKIQSVRLDSRSGLQSGEGQVLPLFDPREAGSTLATDSDYPEIAEWFPVTPFDWGVHQELDGSATLYLRMYPFIYNSATTQYEFYTQYAFTIETSLSDTSITLLDTDAASYDTGAMVQADLWINNTGAARDVTVSAAMYTLGSYERVDGLLLEELEGLQGLATFSTIWDTTGIAAGDYYLIAELRDEFGALLDEHTQAIHLGRLELTALSMEAPALFTPGDVIPLSLSLQNTGDQPASFTAVLQVQQLGGEVVAISNHAVSDLAPGAVFVFEAPWDSTGFTPGEYRVIGYAEFAAQISNIKQATLNTRPLLYLPLLTH